MKQAITANKVLLLTIFVALTSMALAAFATVQLVSSPSALTSQKLEINGTTFRVSVADEPQERYQGLSGRKSLGDQHGMLFVYSEPGDYGFVMRDMEFSIDIIWIDENRQIVGIDTGLQPEEDDLTVYSPPSPVPYVLELPAGSTLNYQLAVGQTVEGI